MYWAREKGVNDDDDDGIYWYSETVTPASTHYWAEQSCFCTTRAI